MRKIILITACLIFCVIFALFAAKIFLPKKEEIVFDQTTRTFLVKGDVKIKKARDGTEWQKMDTFTTLEKGDVIETAGGSSVDVIIGKNVDKSIKIEEKSRVEFEGINPTSMNFSNGKLLVKLKKLEPKSSFIVKAPTAICGARGTGWLQETAPDKTRVCIFESDIYVREVGPNGKPKWGKHIAGEGTQRIASKGNPISEAQKISEGDQQTWEYWDKNVEYLREGEILVNDFDRKENFNNLDGAFGSWNIFYSDPNQYCRDEFTDLERAGGKGYSLKLTYDVDTPFSAYNGFFSKLMDIDISDYKYLVFYIKGDKAAGFTTKISAELKNRALTGRMTVDGITDEWQRMVLPLKEFAGINDFKEMKEFVIVFSDIGVTKKEGVIYIDDIYFARTT